MCTLGTLHACTHTHKTKHTTTQREMRKTNKIDSTRHTPGEIVLGVTLLILMAEGAPGNPGMQVLNAAISEKGPLPHELMAHTLNLYALPGCSSTLTIFCSPACNRGRLHYVSLYPPSLSSPTLSPSTGIW